MITNEEIKNWRENWQTKTGKLLSIHIDDLLNLNDIIKEFTKNRTEKILRHFYL